MIIVIKLIIGLKTVMTHLDMYLARREPDKTSSGPEVETW